jgi:hypothetical protein
MEVSDAARFKMDEDELARHHWMEHQGAHLMPMSNEEKKCQIKQ